uniref:Mitogen-activated protein kinase (EC) n=1 Tax=Ganoderma boninense TaxID=34458 RepID=A0A5K1K4M7_9APHY|nr:Mitogen-activated protein kinase (EC [Ganoderma boninense]
MLRPRYHPDWKPSWTGTKKDPEYCEDGQIFNVRAPYAADCHAILLICMMPQRLEIMDARRISDDRVVVLKKVNKYNHPYEAEIGRLFSTEPLASHSSNRCVPIYDVLQSPLDESMIFLVMPYLMRYHDARFGTIGEAAECLRQLLEVLPLFLYFRVYSTCKASLTDATAS